MKRWLCCLMLIGCFGTAAVARDTPLPPAVQGALKAQGIPESALSVYADDLDNGEVLLSHRAAVLRQPASTIKVLTTTVALDVLGPTYTWKTRLYADGPLRNGVLNGNLVIVGGGDPYLVAERWWLLTTQLRQVGVKQITGDIIIDRSYFAPLNEDRAAFDGAPEKSYNVIPDALMVNFQTSRFTVSGVEEGDRPEILVDPDPANLEFDNDVQLRPGCRRGGSGVRLSTPDGIDGNEVTATGSVGRDCAPSAQSRVIMTAPEYAFGTFKTFFEQGGGKIDGKLRLATLPATARLLVTFESLTMGEIIRLVNKYSNNLMARTLLLTLGAEAYGAPATEEKGQRAVAAWLARNQIDVNGVMLENGSGLSRVERVTSLALSDVLKQAWHSQFMPEFAASLPLAATDGTLRNRFKSPAMRGRMRLKTGHLEGVASLAGFVNAASGKHYVVVVIVNHPGAQLGSGDEVAASVLNWVFAQ